MLHLKYAQERDLLVSSGCVVAGRRALDVGTGDGDFLAFLKHLGFDAHGIEPFAPRAHAARSVGLSVIEGRFDEQTMAKFGDVRFDLICFRESIYYVDDLHQMMALCAKYLRARGMLYIKTLVADSTYFRLVGTISKRAGDACTIMFTRAALTKFLKDFGYRILAQDQIPYSARALLEYYNVPGPLRRIVAPMVEKFVMPRLTPDHVMVVAEWDT
jgi:2-polyprenyl-3-methyl-5-hydroxy-6-metoxy-1,4-benzoquinol methylase